MLTGVAGGAAGQIGPIPRNQIATSLRRGEPAMRECCRPTVQSSIRTWEPQNCCPSAMEPVDCSPCTSELRNPRTAGLLSIGTSAQRLFSGRCSRGWPDVQPVSCTSVHRNCGTPELLNCGTGVRWYWSAAARLAGTWPHQWRGRLSRISAHSRIMSACIQRSVTRQLSIRSAHLRLSTRSAVSLAHPGRVVWLVGMVDRT